jgi:hypothetical protein
MRWCYVSAPHPEEARSAVSKGEARRLVARQILDLVVGREPAGLAAGVFERAVYGDVELAGFAGAQLDVGGAPLLEVIPHTEGLRLITSSAAIFDQHFHGTKVGL